MWLELSGLSLGSDETVCLIGLLLLSCETGQLHPWDWEAGSGDLSMLWTRM